MAIPDALQTAHENLLRVIPEPLTAEEEAQGRTRKGPSDTDPAALHDAARKFVDALSVDPAAAAGADTARDALRDTDREGDRVSDRQDKGTQGAAQVEAEGHYLAALCQLFPASGRPGLGCRCSARIRTAQPFVGLRRSSQGNPSAAGKLAGCGVVDSLEGENESLDGCYWLLHAENLQYDIVVPTAAPAVRQAAEALVRWCEQQSKPGGTTADQGVQPKGTKGKATVAACMIDLIKDPATHNWTAEQFRVKVGCRSRSTVTNTAAWKQLAVARESARLEKAQQVYDKNLDKRRRPKRKGRPERLGD